MDRLSASDPVVVAGAGMGGLTAALAAAERGCPVVLLERSDQVGGSMALSGGLIWTLRDLATARELIPDGDPALQRLLVEGIAEGWRWLEGHGLPLGPVQVCMRDDLGRGRELGLGVPGRRAPFAEAMASRAAALGVRVMPGHLLTGLTREDGELRVSADGPDGPIRLTARAVVLAGGGFQANTAMLREYVSPWATDIVLRSNPGSDGTTQTLARALGAADSNAMHSIYGHSLPAGCAIRPDDFLVASQFYSEYCVILNALGLRFKDESDGVIDEHNAQEGARQPYARYHLVFDERIRRRFVDSEAGLPGVARGGADGRLATVRKLGGRVHVADTLDELAHALPVPTRTARDTLTRYNEAARRGRQPVPPRRRHLLPLEHPPFYGVECVSAVTYTMGGLSVDERMRVLGEGGEPITGLHAAGADAGGVFQDFYGGGLAWALVSGRIAGEGATGP